MVLNSLMFGVVPQQNLEAAFEVLLPVRVTGQQCVVVGPRGMWWPKVGERPM